MDAWLFHPKFVHVPMALGVLMPLVAGGLLVAWWRGFLPARAWIVAVALQATLVASSVAAMKTGEREEDRVERVVAERVIEAHEEAAEIFVWSGAAVFGVMLLGFALSATRGGLPVAALALAGTIVVLGLGYRVGQAGGELVYKHGAASAYAGAIAPGGGYHDEDD
ncbi:hypothetical protein K8I61_07685 [bacterium]|nr:hypothetical protein [bacterium]